MKRLLQRVLWAVRRRVLARWPGLPHSRHPLVGVMRRAWRWWMRPRVAPTWPLPSQAQQRVAMPQEVVQALPAPNWAQSLELQRLAPAAERLRERLQTHRSPT